jgi:hypothetical protein
MTLAFQDGVRNLRDNEEQGELLQVQGRYEGHTAQGVCMGKG